MPFSYDIGRVVVAKRKQSEAEALSEYLTYTGIDAVICNGDDGGDAFCFIMVNEADAERAKASIETFDKMGKEAARASKNAAFYSIKTKLSEISNSAYFFIVCGGIVVILAVYRLISMKALTSVQTAFVWFELVLGAFFLFFGIRIFVKSRQARKHLDAENNFTLKVVGWFLGTYTADSLNKIIEAEGSDAPPSEQRKELIRKLIYREYSIENEDYLNYLTSEVYTAMYHTRKLAGLSKFKH